MQLWGLFTLKWGLSLIKVWSMLSKVWSTHNKHARLSDKLVATCYRILNLLFISAAPMSWYLMQQDSNGRKNWYNLPTGRDS